ncbi:MAG: AAA family ATPase [Candidatus Methylopumilus sp.]|jgi:predicted ATP-dependent protease
MLRTLSPQQLTIHISPQDIGFNDTSELAVRQPTAWIGQAEAEKAARFGLSMQQPGFHLIVLGEQGSGRTSLMLEAMHTAARQLPKSPDLVLLHHFPAPEKPLPVYVKTGQGAELRAEMDRYIRQLVKILPGLLSEGAPSIPPVDIPVEKEISPAVRESISQMLDSLLAKLKLAGDALVLEPEKFNHYITALKQDTLDNIELFQPAQDNEGVLESFLGRYRVNLLVDNRGIEAAPVIYDDDPSFQSLFGGYESSNDNNSPSADFMRLRAGNLLRAHGGMLMLHLRDIHADQQSGSQILEKFHRVLRNRRVQIEESAGTSGQSSASHFAPEALPVDVKVVLIASREEFHELQDELPGFAQYFRIKVDFAERLTANTENYRAIGEYIAAQCAKHGIKHFSAEAVARLIREMQRKIDDQMRISANFSYLQGLVLECAAFSAQHQSNLVTLADVETALAARRARHQYSEQQLRESIVDGELMISVQGREIGQINGLTHIDMGDACFGSPVRISARCYAGDEGVINIDREVEMTGPNHDKGLFILRSWLSANFAALTPLSLTASLVFEQEYHGVEGDSASCAELYALLSALSALGLPQGIAVTGAVNQHGDVMPIGGVNEKIEGYFRVCQRIGLDGTQGVVIPSLNQSHLLLDDEVINAIEQGQFHIYTMEHVLEGMTLLTGISVEATDSDGTYLSETLMGRVQQTLEQFRKAYATNRTGHVRP